MQNLGQDISFAHGDTGSPIVFAIWGIGSLGGAVQHLNRVFAGQQPLAAFVAETEELLDVVDFGTFELIRLYQKSLAIKFDDGDVAQNLAVQWVIIPANPFAEHNFLGIVTLLKQIKQTATAYQVWETVLGKVELLDLYVKTAVVYDILLTRMMTQIRSGGHGTREMYQNLKGSV